MILQSLFLRSSDTQKGTEWFIYYWVTELTSFHEFLPLKTQSQSHRDLIRSEKIKSYSLKNNSDQLFFFHLTKEKLDIISMAILVRRISGF